MTDFLVSAGNNCKLLWFKINNIINIIGIKPCSIVSYNHLGNNDGYNLSSEAQFKSKETSKKSCVDDILNSNKILFPK